MLFKKRPALVTPMDQFVQRSNLNTDESAVLDVYLTGVSHALVGINAVLSSNDKPPLFRSTAERALDAADLENIVEAFLKQRPDMKTQPLGLYQVAETLTC